MYRLCCTHRPIFWVVGCSNLFVYVYIFLLFTDTKVLQAVCQCSRHTLNLFIPVSPRVMPKFTFFTKKIMVLVQILAIKAGRTTVHQSKGEAGDKTACKNSEVRNMMAYKKHEVRDVTAYKKNEVRDMTAHKDVKRFSLLNDRNKFDRQQEMFLKRLEMRRKEASYKNRRTSDKVRLKAKGKTLARHEAIDKKYNGLMPQMMKSMLSSVTPDINLRFKDEDKSFMTDLLQNFIESIKTTKINVEHHMPVLDGIRSFFSEASDYVWSFLKEPSTFFIAVFGAISTCWAKIKKFTMDEFKPFVDFLVVGLTSVLPMLIKDYVGDVYKYLGCCAEQFSVFVKSCYDVLSTLFGCGGLKPQMNGVMTAYITLISFLTLCGRSWTFDLKTAETVVFNILKFDRSKVIEFTLSSIFDSIAIVIRYIGDFANVDFLRTWGYKYPEWHDVIFNLHTRALEIDKSEGRITWTPTERDIISDNLADIDVHIRDLQKTKDPRIPELLKIREVLFKYQQTISRVTMSVASQMEAIGIAFIGEPGVGKSALMRLAACVHSKVLYGKKGVPINEGDGLYNFEAGGTFDDTLRGQPIAVLDDIFQMREQVGDEAATSTKIIRIINSHPGNANMANCEDKGRVKYHFEMILATDNNTMLTADHHATAIHCASALYRRFPYVYKVLISDECKEYGSIYKFRNSVHAKDLPPLEVIDKFWVLRPWDWEKGQPKANSTDISPSTYFTIVHEEYRRKKTYFYDVMKPMINELCAFEGAIEKVPASKAAPEENVSNEVKQKRNHKHKGMPTLIDVEEKKTKGLQPQMLSDTLFNEVVSMSHCGLSVLRPQMFLGHAKKRVKSNYEKQDALFREEHDFMNVFTDDLSDKISRQVFNEELSLIDFLRKTLDLGDLGYSKDLRVRYVMKNKFQIRCKLRSILGEWQTAGLIFKDGSFDIFILLFLNDYSYQSMVVLAACYQWIKRHGRDESVNLKIEECMSELYATYARFHKFGARDKMEMFEEDDGEEHYVTQELIDKLSNGNDTYNAFFYQPLETIIKIESYYSDYSEFKITGIDDAVADAYYDYIKERNRSSFSVLSNKVSSIYLSLMKFNNLKYILAGVSLVAVIYKIADSFLPGSGYLDFSEQSGRLTKAKTQKVKPKPLVKPKTVELTPQIRHNNPLMDSLVNKAVNNTVCFSSSPLAPTIGHFFVLKEYTAVGLQHYLPKFIEVRDAGGEIWGRIACDDPKVVENYFPLDLDLLIDDCYWFYRGIDLCSSETDLCFYTIKNKLQLDGRIYKDKRYKDLTKHLPKSVSDEQAVNKHNGVPDRDFVCVRSARLARGSKTVSTHCTIYSTTGYVQQSVDYGDCVVGTSYIQKMVSYDGDCGLPSLAHCPKGDSQQCVIAGIHCAGTSSESDPRSVCAAILYQDWVDYCECRGMYTDSLVKQMYYEPMPEGLEIKDLSRDSFESYKRIGLEIPRATWPQNTALRENKRFVQAHGQASWTHPAVLRPMTYEGMRRNPIMLALSKYTKDSVNIPHMLLDFAHERLCRHLLPLFKDYNFEVLNKFEAIYGVSDGCGSYFIQPIPATSSAGIPWCAYSKHKSAFIKDGEPVDSALRDKLYDKIDIDLEALKNYEKPDWIIKTFPKDEIRSVEKWLECKTRLISGSSIDSMCIQRMYFAYGVRALMDTRLINGFALGYNPYTEHEFLRNLFAGYDCIDGDFSGFDTDQPWCVYSKTIEFMNLLYRIHPDHKDEDDTIRYEIGKNLNTCLHQLLREGNKITLNKTDLLTDDMGKRYIEDAFGERIYASHILSEEDDCITVVLCDEEIFVETTGIQPSGCFLTSPGNTYTGLLYATCVLSKIYAEETFGKPFEEITEEELYQIPHSVTDSPKVQCGDDHIFAVPHIMKPYTNQVRVKEAYESMGISYTTATKTDAASDKPKTFDECSFLKRNDKLVNGRHVAALEISSILKMLEWVDKDMTTEMEHQIIDTMMMEFSAHGFEVFCKYNQVLLDYCTGKGIYPGNVCFLSQERALRVHWSRVFNTKFLKCEDYVFCM
nr:MAG: polyprotein 1 [Picornavirales sp.]